jgi:hypothetical protein
MPPLRTGSPASVLDGRDGRRRLGRLDQQKAVEVALRGRKDDRDDAEPAASADRNAVSDAHTIREIDLADVLTVNIEQSVAEHPRRRQGGWILTLTVEKSVMEHPRRR